ncbi:hypothetical protein C8Q80DRAFT_1117378 [Daedaleopsis nitida]|nr:hypothetical protein C8Q80DRAFT_1117378 [Daedaleopsis nitida]
MGKVLPRRRSSTVSCFPFRPRERLPRRRCEADAEEHYRKEKLGLPGPVDVWLAARMAQDHSIHPNSDSDANADSDGGWPAATSRGDDEVLCTVQLQCIKAPDDADSIFSDPDTFLLHLTTMSVSRDGPDLRSTSSSLNSSTTGGRCRTGDESDSPNTSTSPSESGSEYESEEETELESEPPVRRTVLGRYEGHPESLDAPQWTKLPAGEPVVFRESAAAVADVLVRAALWNDCMTTMRSWCGCGG